VRIFSFIALIIVVCTQQAVAGTRNVYGYVFGLGTNRYAVTRIVIRSASAVYYADGWGFSWLAPGGLRWYKNGLPTDRQYVVTVETNGYGSRNTNFYLPTGGGDFKTPNIGF
jgi:hypothetical protein